VRGGGNCNFSLGGACSPNEVIDEINNCLGMGGGRKEGGGKRGSSNEAESPCGPGKSVLRGGRGGALKTERGKKEGEGGWGAKGDGEGTKGSGFETYRN